MTTLPFPNDSRAARAASDPSVESETSASAIVARDREWVARIRRGDIAAFEAMYRAYKDGLGGYVQSLLGTREAAEEVVQDLFFRLWEQRELWEPAGPLNSYLFRAARNRAINHLRHQRVEMRFRERTAGEVATHAANLTTPTPEDTLRLSDIEDAIERAIDALPPRCREVFRLNRYQRLSYAEVAQVLQISVKTVEMQMGRALAALRQQLAEWRP